MKSLSDEELVLYVYNEHPDPEGIAAELESDPDAARRHQEIVRALAAAHRMAVPEPQLGYEERVWRRLQPELGAPAPGSRRGFRLWGGAPWRLAALAATLVAALGGAFWAGRSSHRVDTSAILAGALPPDRLEPAARERLLLASIAGHLESSSLLLTDLSNSPATGELDGEPAWAERLLAANRLYRQAAQRSGQRRIVALLDELEPLLLELSHAPARGEIRDLQHQIEQRDLLFKVRVLGTRLGAGRSASAPTVRSL